MIFIDEKICKANYQQNPFNILTKENLDRLEKHCKKAIHYERGNIREEHEITLQLIYEHQNSVPKDKIQELLDKYEHVEANEDAALSLYADVKKLLEREEK